jgi:hypothetical protein
LFSHVYKSDSLISNSHVSPVYNYFIWNSVLYVSICITVIYQASMFLVLTNLISYQTSLFLMSRFGSQVFKFDCFKQRCFSCLQISLGGVIYKIRRIIYKSKQDLHSVIDWQVSLFFVYKCSLIKEIVHTMCPLQFLFCDVSSK